MQPGPEDIGKAGRNRLMLAAPRRACLTVRLERLLIGVLQPGGQSNCPARTMFRAARRVPDRGRVVPPVRE